MAMAMNNESVVSCERAETEAAAAVDFHII
jgi:hypothetical protein